MHAPLKLSEIWTCSERLQAVAPPRQLEVEARRLVEVGVARGRHRHRLAGRRDQPRCRSGRAGRTTRSGPRTCRPRAAAGRRSGRAGTRPATKRPPMWMRSLRSLPAATTISLPGPTSVRCSRSSWSVPSWAPKWWPRLMLTTQGRAAGLAEDPADRRVGVDEVGLDQQKARAGRHALEAARRREPPAMLATWVPWPLSSPPGPGRARPAVLELGRRVLAVAVGLIEQPLDPERAAGASRNAGCDRSKPVSTTPIKTPAPSSGNGPRAARAQADLRQRRGQPRPAALLALHPAHRRIGDQARRVARRDPRGDEAAAEILDRLGRGGQQVADVLRVARLDQDRGAGLLGRRLEPPGSPIPAARAASAGRSRRSARPTSEASETDAFGDSLKVDFSIARRPSFAQQ